MRKARSGGSALVRTRNWKAGNGNSGVGNNDCVRFKQNLSIAETKCLVTIATTSRLLSAVCYDRCCVCAVGSEFAPSEFKVVQHGAQPSPPLSPWRLPCPDIRPHLTRRRIDRKERLRLPSS